jgi:hypothetical protein
MTRLRNSLHTGGRRFAAKSAVDSHGKEAASLAELKIPAWVSQASRLTINTRILQTVLLLSLAIEAGQERNRNLQITDQETWTFIFPISRRIIELIERGRDKLPAAHARLRPQEH